MPHLAPSGSPSRPAGHAGIDPSAEAVLCRDPGGVYLRSDPRTRWQYHAALAEWERRTGLDRVVLSRTALARAEATAATDGDDAPGAHVGYYLLGDGARALEADRALSPGRATGQPGGLAPGLLFPLAITLTLALVTACVIVLHRNAAPGWAQAVAAICAVPLAWVYASRMVRSLPWRRRLDLPVPRLRAGEGQASDEATLIVVPAIVPSPARAHALVQRLWMLSEAHPAAGFRFALLSDFDDAPSETAPEDEAVLTALQAAIAALNERGRDGLGDRFFALHRRRTWSATQGAWIGWERKRGKLREVMRLLQPRSPGPGATTFAWRFGDLAGLLSRTRVSFVITVDESTWLAPGAADELIRAAAHPLNRPVVCAATGRVTSGYTVLQPTVTFTLENAPPETGGAPRRSPAPRARPVGAPSFSFRTFGVGIHKGAGALYHADAFRHAVDGAFPDEVVLHHDLLDGFAGRTGEVYDAVVHQPWPRTYLGQARRGHRWLRGVLQAMPFVFSGTRAAYRNPLTGIQRTLIAEVALQEVSTPASLVFLLLAWTVLPGSPAAWTLLACPALLMACGSVLRQAIIVPIVRLGGGRRRPGWGYTLNQAAAGLFAQVVLIHQSSLVADAVARVAWRLAVSRRHLLEWAPRHDSPSPVTPLSDYWRALWLSPLVGGLLLAALALRRPPIPWIAAPFALAWLAAPALVGLGDRHLFGRKEGS